MSDAGGQALIEDAQFTHLVRWVVTARLICLVLAAPFAFWGESGLVGAVAVAVLGLFSLVLGRSDRLLGRMVRHPLLGSLDLALTVVVLLAVPAGDPASLAAVCSALLAGLLFPPRILVLLIVPLMLAGATAALQGAARQLDPRLWLGGALALPILMLGLAMIGVVIRQIVGRLVEARDQTAEAVAARSAAEERARLARDMHDSVGKSLYGISLAAQSLPGAVERDPALAASTAQGLSEAAEQAARQARELLVSLRRSEIDRPTIEVVSELTRAWGEATGIAVEIDGVTAVDVSAPVAEEMAAALGEMLHIIAKHAEASRVTVRLADEGERVALVVIDDGVGFALDRAARKAGHFGLRGLAERADRVAGELEIDSSPGEGTRIRWTALRDPAPTPG